MYGRFTFCSVSMRRISVIHSLIVRLTSVHVRQIKLMKRPFTGEKTDTPFKFRTLTEFETDKTHEKRKLLRTYKCNIAAEIVYVSLQDLYSIVSSLTRI